jgi:hypothetical protein
MTADLDTARGRAHLLKSHLPLAFQYACGITYSTKEVVPMTEEKARENRLRRMAERRGLRLEKSRRRDPGALTYGRYWLLRGKEIVGDLPYSFDSDRECTTTLDEIEKAFTLPTRRPKAKSK